MSRIKKEAPACNIYLIGFMGCGKSSVSRFFAREYKMQMVEMDQRIEEEEGRTISGIFAESGEEYFRKLETGLLIRLGEKKRHVISCGGGAAMREENVAEMKKNGRIVLLRAKPETIYERVKDSHVRPLLEGNMNVEYIRELMEQRRPKYEAAADIAVDTDGKSIPVICREIIDRLNMRSLVLPRE